MFAGTKRLLGGSKLWFGGVKRLFGGSKQWAFELRAGFLDLLAAFRACFFVVRLWVDDGNSDGAFICLRAVVSFAEIDAQGSGVGNVETG